MRRPQRDLWVVPRLWPDSEVFILGGGPSLANVDLEPLRDRRVIAVNQAYKLGQWDALFYGDCGWLRRYGGGLLGFAGLKVTTCEQHTKRKDIKVVRRKNAPYGITEDRARLVWNLSSGACAINLAVHLGARRIVLLGFDMRRIEVENDGKKISRANYHDDYERPTGKVKRTPYERFLRPFPNIAQDLQRMGVECVNATPGSRLEVFPIVHPDEVLRSPSPVC